MKHTQLSKKVLIKKVDANNYVCIFKLTPTSCGIFGFGYLAVSNPTTTVFAISKLSVAEDGGSILPTDSYTNEQVISASNCFEGPHDVNHGGAEAWLGSYTHGHQTQNGNPVIKGDNVVLTLTIGGTTLCDEVEIANTVNLCSPSDNTGATVIGTEVRNYTIQPNVINLNNVITWAAACTVGPSYAIQADSGSFSSVAGSQLMMTYDNGRTWIIPNPTASGNPAKVPSMEIIIAGMAYLPNLRMGLRTNKRSVLNFTNSNTYANYNGGSTTHYIARIGSVMKSVAANEVWYDDAQWLLYDTRFASGVDAGM